MSSYGSEFADRIEHAFDYPEEDSVEIEDEEDGDIPGTGDDDSEDE